MPDIESSSSGLYRNPVTTFPARWGEPPADYEDRCRWIKENVAVEVEMRKGAAPIRAESDRFWREIEKLEKLEVCRRQVRLRELEIMQLSKG